LTKTLTQLIDEKFGVRVRPVINPLISSVGTTPARLFANNPNRFAFLVVNLSGNELYILNENTVSPTRGILLVAYGGTYVGLWNEEFHLVGWEWWAVGSAAGTNLLSLELVGY